MQTLDAQGAQLFRKINPHQGCVTGYTAVLIIHATGSQWDSSSNQSYLKILSLEWEWGQEEMGARSLEQIMQAEIYEGTISSGSLSRQHDLRCKAMVEMD